MTRYLCTMTLAGLLFALPLPARGQDSGKLETIRSLNQEAVAAFESYSFNKARKRLLKALGIAKQARLDKSKEAVQTLVLLGVAYVAGSNDLYRGLHYFVRALRLDKKAAIPSKLATPQLLRMFKTAQNTVKTVKTPPTIVLQQKDSADSAGPAAGPKGRGLLHTPIDSAKRGYPIPVKAQAGLDVQAQRLYLHYRPAGTVKFLKLPMKKTRGVFRAAIPASATGGRYVHYYIEAVDQRGRLAASMGSARSPNVVTIK